VLDVKNSLRCAALATSLALAFAATAAVAQVPVARPPVGTQSPQVRPQTAAPTGGAVAVIDISKIFKEHRGFRAKLEDMKKDVAAAETSLKAERDEMKKVADQAKQFTVGSPDYKRAEERLATMQAQLQLRVNLQKKEFMDKEAHIYYEVYTQIEKEVADFARRHGISLVLRYNDIDMNPEVRENVLAGVNRAVVYQNNIDITFDILDRINPRNAGPIPTNTIPR
jgi:Skp family chaperone for outer membrane proteins